MFKVIQVSTKPSVQVSWKACGPYYWCQQIDLLKSHIFCYICLNKLFLEKNDTNQNVLNIFEKLFSWIFGSRRPQYNETGKVIRFKPFSIYRENFKSISLIVIENLDSNSEPEVIFPKISIGYKLQIYTNHSWKELGNWLNSLWEMVRTNFVEKTNNTNNNKNSSVRKQ